MRSLLTIVSLRVELHMRELHVELYGNSDIYEGTCPFCLSGRLVVLPLEERWVCYGCLYGGTGADGRRKFLEMLIAGTKTRRLKTNEFTLTNAGIPGRPPRKEWPCYASAQGGRTMAAKYELKKGATGQFTFNLKAANGEIILTSEQYKEKAGALNGIESVKKNSPDDARYERKTAKNGKPFFTLTAANGQIIGKSEMYESVKSMENGIASVKKNGPEAKVEDLA